MQIYYIIQKDGKWAELPRQNFEVKLKRGNWNKRTIVGFRLNPGATAGIEAEIDYISFTGSPNKGKAVDARKKRTTT